MGVYRVTKHGVVSLSETLSCELVDRGARIGVSVLCPAWVNTWILDSERSRPAELQNEPGSELRTVEDEAAIQARLQAIQTGLSPQHVAEEVFDAIRNGKLYILTHPDWNPFIQKRMERILHEYNPTRREK